MAMRAAEWLPMPAVKDAFRFSPDPGTQHTITQKRLSDLKKKKRIPSTADDPIMTYDQPRGPFHCMTHTTHPVPDGIKTTCFSGCCSVNLK